MTPDSRVSQLFEIVADLKRKVTKLEEQIRPNTCPEVLESRINTTTEAMRRIEDSIEMCAKYVEQVSYN